jgi:hypothetical protein
MCGGLLDSITPILPNAYTQEGYSTPILPTGRYRKHLYITKTIACGYRKAPPIHLLVVIESTAQPLCIRYIAPLVVIDPT